MQLLSGEVAADGAKAATGQLVTAWNGQYGRRDVSFDQEIGEGEFTFAGMIADAWSYVPGGIQVVRPALAQPG